MTKRNPDLIHRTLRHAACLMLAALSLTGCVGYQLGSMLPADIRTVHVPTFINQTEEPLLEAVATRVAVNEIQRDGSLQIAALNTADAELRVSLLKMELVPLGFSTDRRAAADEYRLVITAEAVLERRSTGDVVVRIPREIGEETFLVTGDLTSSKQVAIEPACEDLAQRLISRLMENW
jgi:outer membrane lipopolysaccharide assembly protein LptE/RlpB